MVETGTLERGRSLAESRMDPLDKTLVRDLGTVAQELIDRGLYGSSVQVTEAKGAAERNLDQRAQVIADESYRQEMVDHNFELGKKFFSYSVLRRKLRSLVTAFSGLDDL